MDPCSAVGLAASILQIINTTAQIIQYLKDVRNAPEERAQIQREAVSLLGLLMNLRDRAEHANEKDPWYVQICSLARQGGPLDQYQSAMIALAKKLSSVSFVEKLEKRLLWTFDKKQIKATLVLIERVKSLISLALQGDHFELSLALKTETHEVKDYITIMSKSLENVVEGIAELKLGQKQAAKQYLDEEQHKALEWLSPLNFASKQVDTFDRHQPGTGEWLFEEEVFKAWLAGDINALWCSGIPGAGKTILTSVVVNHLEHRYPCESNAVAILYLSYRDQEEQSAKNLIGSLLRQVAHRKRTLSDDVLGLYNQHALKGSRPTITEFSTLLHSEITGLSEVFVLVDAMDECSVSNWTREELLTTLQSLLKMPNVRLMITSRPVASVEAHLQGMACLEIRAADEDIRKYIENRIPKERRLMPYVRGDDAFRVSIIETIIAKAQGMFLMAQLHLRSLAEKYNKRDVRLALHSLPEKLDDTYAAAVERIFSQGKGDVQLAKRTLMWISCAKRPLSIIELQHALAIEPGAKELNPESLPDKDVIVDVCSGLVAIDRKSNTIRLVHYTTQDYLVRVRAELFATAEIDMTFCCLTYLLFSTSAQILEPEDSTEYTSINVERIKAAYPFWSYAVRFWGSHAHEKAQYDTRIQHLIFQLLEPSNKALGLARSEPLRDNLFYLYALRDVPGMHTAAYFDLTGLVDTLLDRGTLVDAKPNEYSLTALHCAAIGGHIATLRLLLDRGALINMPDGWGDTALMMGAWKGYKDSVQLLLEKGADMDRHNLDRKTALHLAAQQNYRNIVQLLLKRGADVNRQDRYGNIALHLAAWKGHQGIVELLLEKGVDVNRQGPYAITALHVAAERGHQGIVELLLEKGAGINGQGHYERTALHLAARKGHQGIVELLLEKGVDVNRQDCYERTALHLAARKGHQGIVELLLEKGVDVDEEDNDGKTALHSAAQEGHQRIVELLLEKGVDVDEEDNDGKTALHSAAQEGHQRIVELLLEKGADVNARQHDGATALHVAANEGYKSTVQLLVDAGADLEAKQSYEDLQLTASDIDAGADLEPKQSYKDLQLTASDIAKTEGHMDVFELLEKAREQRRTLPIRNLIQSQNLVDESNSPAD